jgi:5'-nucleotidase
MSRAEPLRVVGAFDDGIESDGLRTTAAAVTAQVILALPDLPRGQILNINIPNVPQHLLRGIRRGPLAGFGTAAIDIIEAAEDHLQVTMSGLDAEPAPGTDAALLAAGYACVTPLQPMCEAPAPWLPWPVASAAGILTHP